MILLIFIIKTIFISGLLFGYYWLFLRNRSFHLFNRFFLLSIPALSLLLPILHFSIPALWRHMNPGSPIRLLGVGQGKLEEAVTIYANKPAAHAISWQWLLLTLIVCVSVFLAVRFLKTIRFLLQLRKNAPLLKLPGATVFFVSEKGTPFSFFHFIYWGKEMEWNSAAAQQILRHELYHVMKKHSWDMLALEILSIGMWFNPFIHLIGTELRAAHEYAADEYAASQTNAYEYANLLLWKVNGTAVPLTHPFFKNLIKRRIAMITKINKTKKTLLGRLMIFPLLFVLTGLFSFAFHNPLHLSANKMIRVVIDAGHGGIDPGTSSNGTLEKDINLQIAKMIKKLSGDYGIDVIMSRETDELPGKGTDIDWSLKYRAAMARKENADLFVSIHTNAINNKGTQDQNSGFDIYVPHNDSKIYPGSVQLGSLIASSIKGDYPIAPELKERKDRILILDDAGIPAVLVECGYIDNKSDLAYLLDKKNQEKMARDILEGIRKYAMQTTSYFKSTNEANDSIPADTLTKESLKNFNVNQIATLGVDTNTKLITIITKDGKKYVEVITPEMLRSWDSSRIAEMNHPDTANPNHAVFTKVEVEAEYPGGQQAWYAYLQKNLNYPDAAVKKEIQGQVMVKFIVKKSGMLTDIHAVSGPKELMESSVNVIKGSGKWIPAKQNGLIVESWRMQPINYKLEAK